MAWPVWLGMATLAVLYALLNLWLFLASGLPDVSAQLLLNTRQSLENQESRAAQDAYFRDSLASWVALTTVLQQHLVELERRQHDLDIEASQLREEVQEMKQR
jgi:hypothetical protein